MNYEFFSFPVNNFHETKWRVLSWLNQFSTFCFLDNNEYKLQHHKYECIVAAGAAEWVTATAGNAFEELTIFTKENKGWLFGHFAYDLKNELENLQSKNEDEIGFPDLHFFTPQILILIGVEEISIATSSSFPHQVWNAIQKEALPGNKKKRQAVTFQSRFTLFEYIDIVGQLQKHIQRGDCYEINFCQEFYCTDVTINPVRTYAALSAVSPTPFGAFYRLQDKFLVCASPERYLQKTGNHLISQPIKGTWKRDINDEETDTLNRQALYHNLKERSENVMVVDLVRNDLSKICEEGSVKVDELFGIYSFPQLHQMISTISGTLPENKHWIDVIKATFPMGSMTGAPKKKVMELIEQYEKTKRGIFSGAVGYVTPEGNMDFNVVIRSILYNQSTHYLSYQVGSGITFYSDAEKEYEECLLKSAAIKKVLE